MVGIDSILVHAIPFLMVLTRITGLFLFTPMLTSTSIPTVFKAMLAFIFDLPIRSDANAPPNA